jgi:hypothetical protein
MTLIAAAGALLSLAAIAVVKAQSCTTCRDGRKTSSTGRGTCSWHGGINRD